MLEMPCVIIVSPLNAIIFKKLQAYGSKIIHITSAILAHPTSQLTLGKFVYLIGHPEDLLCVQALTLFKSSSWQERVSNIVVDEAHCLVAWGEDFRKDFQRIDDLKSQFTDAFVLALTATASKIMQKSIEKILHFKKGLYSIKTEPVSQLRANVANGRHRCQQFANVGPTLANQPIT